MNKLLTAAALVASLGVALPAAAQTWGGGYDRDARGAAWGDHGLETRIDRGVRNGSLTANEARSLMRQLDDLQRLERQYARNGISAGEARRLDQRYASLEARIRMESRDRETGYGRGFNGYR